MTKMTIQCSRTKRCSPEQADDGGGISESHPDSKKRAKTATTQEVFVVLTVTFMMILIRGHLLIDVKYGFGSLKYSTLPYYVSNWASPSVYTQFMDAPYLTHLNRVAPRDRST